MQAFCCEVVRALTKLGMAMAASNPMMATTIMISTSVNPALLLFFFCIIIYFFLFLFSGVNTAKGGLIIIHFCSLIALCVRNYGFSSIESNLFFGPRWKGPYLLQGI